MNLELLSAVDHPELLAAPTAQAIAGWTGATPASAISVASIDPDLADTAAFCEHYEVAPEDAVNCVVIAARRGVDVRMAACMIRASTRADVNGLVRRHLGARKASFAAMDVATELSGMEYGGITPIGLPADWPVLVDSAVLSRDHVIIGSGVRHSKLWLPAAALADLPTAEVLESLSQ